MTSRHWSGPRRNSNPHKNRCLAPLHFRRPVAGVDPAARDFILQTILTNYSPESTVLISTHLIADIEPVLDEVIFLKEGRVVRHDSTDNIRGAEGKSVDEVFREVFRTIPMGGEWPC